MEHPTATLRKFFFAPKQVKKKDKIRCETVERIGKGGRFIFLKKEVTHPSKTVANDWNCR
jgi:hypothetical protein